MNVENFPVYHGEVLDAVFLFSPSECGVKDLREISYPSGVKPQDEELFLPLSCPSGTVVYWVD